jgi:hypothetical protein
VWDVSVGKTPICVKCLDDCASGPCPRVRRHAVAVRHRGCTLVRWDRVAAGPS